MADHIHEASGSSAPQLTKQQAGRINRTNRNISANLNALMDNLSSMTYGTQKDTKIDSLITDFNSLVKSEIHDIRSSTDGDSVNFITRLISDNNKKLAGASRDLEDIFGTDEGQIQALFNEQYKNRLIKQADLHEVASQLVELKQAITVTRDAIISADIVDGTMSRTLTVENDSMSTEGEDYIPIIESVEKKFGLQKKIKEFIIPRSLEYGEYYVYAVPYSKIFEDFSKEKSQGKYNAYNEAAGRTLYECYMEGMKDKKFDKTDLYKSVMESAQSCPEFDDILRRSDMSKGDAQKQMSAELKSYMENITICNEAIPLCVLEEGVDTYRQYYQEFVEKTMTEEKKSPSFTFASVMKNIDSGVHGYETNGALNRKGNKKIGEKFNNIQDCYVRLISPLNLLPIKISDEIIGYYYVQEDDITPLAGILTSTMYYDKYDMNHGERNIIDIIAGSIVKSFDKKFLNSNMKFKKLIVEALNYYKLNNKRLRFQFIPKEYIVPFKINTDENGNGVSIIEDSLFYAKLYLMLLLFKILSIVTNSNDTKVNYIRQSGIDKNVANKIQEIARKKQERKITMADMFSYTTLINKIGQGNEMYVPTGKGNERGIETEILSGQDVQINGDLMDMLKKAYISGTGVPDVLLNYYNEADFAKTLELANNRFQGRVISFQLDYNEQITQLYRQICRYATNIPEQVIDSLQFNFVQPKSANSNITNDLLNNHNTLVEFLTGLYYGQDFADDPKKAAQVSVFKKNLAKDRLAMLNFDHIEEIFKKSNIEGMKDPLNPENQDVDDMDTGDENNQ